MSSQHLQQNQRAAVAQVLVAGAEWVGQMQLPAQICREPLCCVAQPCSCTIICKATQDLGEWRTLVYAHRPGGIVFLYFPFFSFSHGTDLCCISTSCVLCVPAKHLTGFTFKNTQMPPAASLVLEGQQALCLDKHRNAVSQKLWCIG